MSGQAPEHGGNYGYQTETWGSVSVWAWSNLLNGINSGFRDDRVDLLRDLTWKCNGYVLHRMVTNAAADNTEVNLKLP